MNDIYISIITVNYNGMSDTCHMIDSLMQYLSEVSYEIIIVDNASLKDEITEIQAKYKNIHCIRSDSNLGFAGGNNLGIIQAKGKYVLLLNNDTYINDDSLLDPAEFLDSNATVGAVSPKIKFADSNIIQFAGYTDLSQVTLRNSLIGFGEADLGQYDTPAKSPFLHGAAMMLRRDIIKKVGLMPEIYFLYYEELDWCEQIKKNGFELWYTPQAVVFHKESRSVGQNSPLRCYYMTRNRLLYAWRNRRGLVRLAAILYQFLIANPKGIFTYILNGRFDLVGASIRGMMSFTNMKKTL